MGCQRRPPTRSNERRRKSSRRCRNIDSWNVFHIPLLSVEVFLWLGAKWSKGSKKRMSLFSSPSRVVGMTTAQKDRHCRLLALDGERTMLCFDGRLASSTVNDDVSKNELFWATCRRRNGTLFWTSFYSSHTQA